MGSSIISFNCFSLTIAFPFTSPFFYVIRDIGFKIIFLYEFRDHPLIITFIMFLSEMFAGFGEIIRKICLAPVNEGQLSASSRYSQNDMDVIAINVIKQEKDSKLLKKCILLIIITVLIDLICYTLISFICSRYETQQLNLHTEMRISPVFFMCILNYKFFNIILYKHQKISIIIIAVGFIILLVTDIIANNLNQENITDSKFYYSLPFLVVINIAYSFKQIIDKILMENKFISPFKLLFYQGCVGCFISSILIIIASFINCPELHIYQGICTPGRKIENVKTFFNELLGDDFINILTGLLMILFGGCFVNLWLLLTKQYMTPTHRCVSDALNALCTWICLFTPLNKLDLKNEKLLIFDCFAYLFIVFGCLVYCELLTFDFCGMKKDTKYEIMKRGNLSNEDDLQTLKDFSILPSKNDNLEPMI